KVRPFTTRSRARVPLKLCPDCAEPELICDCVLIVMRVPAGMVSAAANAASTISTAKIFVDLPSTNPPCKLACDMNESVWPDNRLKHGAAGGRPMSCADSSVQSPDAKGTKVRNLIELALPRKFYARDPVSVGRELLGKVLVRREGRRIHAGRIIEVEAYLGER